jgi:hypothetical protein
MRAWADCQRECRGTVSRRQAARIFFEKVTKSIDLCALNLRLMTPLPKNPTTF